MEEMLKVAAIAVAAAVCAVVVKKSTQELGLVLAVAAAIVICGFVLGALGQIRGVVDELTALAGISPAVIAPVLKTVGIAIITRVAAEICRDAKESGIAAMTEIAGAVLALLVALPLLRAVLSTVTGLL
ncbi:MAG: stage III sporulation protein AD [Oscillospiraceae bacterium]|nr:stage III sporulation protein AD [Oscillospiraceae bacterium]